MWWTQSKAIKHLRDMLRNGASVEACIERLIAIDASLPKYVQCRNGRIGYRNGVPVFNYCNRYECWFHGSQRIHGDVERIIAELAGYTPKTWYMVTIGYADVQRPTQTMDERRAFIEKTRSILTAWRVAANRHGRTLKRCAVYGFKSDSSQMHVHVLSNWIHPDATFSHHRQSHAVMRSAWLESLCELSDTTCHIEIVSDPLAVGRYMGKNVTSTIGEIPSGTVRALFSREWIKRDEVMEARNKIVRCLHCGQVGVGEQYKCSNCGGRDWSQSRTLYHTAEGLPKTGSPTIYYTEVNAPPQNTPMKQCPQCGETKPHTPDNFHRDRSQPSGLESVCKTCRTKRNHDLSRQSMHRASKANENAQNAAIRQNKPIESVYQLTSAEVESLYMSASGDSGDCCYCGHPLGDDWSLEHVIPLSRGGGNDPSNLLIVHGRCNASKGDKMPERWASECGSRGIVIDGITPDTMPIQQRLEMD